MKIIHCNSPKFSLPNSQNDQFAKIFPRHSFALYGIWFSGFMVRLFSCVKHLCMCKTRIGAVTKQWVTWLAITLVCNFYVCTYQGCILSRVAMNINFIRYGIFDFLGICS